MTREPGRAPPRHAHGDLHQRLFHSLFGNFQGLVAANVSLDLQKLQAMLNRKGKKQQKGLEAPKRRDRKQVESLEDARVKGPALWEAGEFLGLRGEWGLGFPGNSNGRLDFLGQHKRKPEIPVVTRESRRNSRKTTWLPRHRKMRPDRKSVV